MMAGKEVAKLSDAVANYPALHGDPTRLLAVLRENMGGEKLTEFDLERIKMPSGGGGFWEVPSIDGPQALKVLEGVVVLTKNVRAYWPTALEEGSGSDPPQCVSGDAIIGVGDPGGACETCPYSQFGSHRDGRGQACKQMRQLFLLTEQSMLPVVLTLSPTSLAPARKFFMRLASSTPPRYYWETTVKVSLEKATSGANEYSRAVFALGTALSDTDAAAVGAYKAALEPILAARLPGQDEVA
jgi:hypothetical protein